MKYFLDCEFNQAVDPVQLISLGLVAEDGREFYAVSTEFDEKLCDGWLKKNVLDPKILLHTKPDIVGTLLQIRQAAEEFLLQTPEIEVWGYYAAYDWYLFTRLWGFMSMPKQFPKLCLDVKQYQIHSGFLNERKLPEFEPEHNALVDARWNRAFYQQIAAWIDKIF